MIIIIILICSGACNIHGTYENKNLLVFPKHVAIARGTKNYFVSISALYHCVLQGTVFFLFSPLQSHHFLAAQYCMPPLEEVWVSSSLLDLLLVSC